jgi:hypothetical protein
MIFSMIIRIIFLSLFKINIIQVFLSKIHPMKLSFVKSIVPKFTFILGLSLVLLWACGDSTQSEATETEEVEVPAAPADTTVIDTTVVDSTGVPKDPVGNRTPKEQGGSETPQ